MVCLRRKTNNKNSVVSIILYKYLQITVPTPEPKYNRKMQFPIYYQVKQIMLAIFLFLGIVTYYILLYLKGLFVH